MCLTPKYQYMLHDGWQWQQSVKFSRPIMTGSRGFEKVFGQSEGRITRQSVGGTVSNVFDELSLKQNWHQHSNFTEL